LEGVVLIEGKELAWLKDQLINLQQQNLVLQQYVRQLLPKLSQSSVPDFISIRDACKKYKVSHTTINNKIKAFSLAKGRTIDRIRSGAFYLINEVELQEALRIKGQCPKAFTKSLQANDRIKLTGKA
jgi:hypothetical protein